MKKILMIASAVSHFENFHIPYIKALSEQENVIHTAALESYKNPLVQRHIQLPFRKKLFHPNNIKVILILAKLMRKEKYDIMCTNSTLAGFCGRMALILSGRKSTAALHICHGYLFSDGKGLKNKVYLFFEKLVRRRTDRLAVMNGEDLAIAEKYSLGRSIIYINGMGLDGSKFPQLPAQKTSALRKELGAGENTTLFLCAAEFSPRKNQRVILHACSLLKDKDYIIAFAGNGELLEDCKALAKELDVEKHVRFLGLRSDMNCLFRAADCLVSASIYEGMPFNVMEALYCGDDVILSDAKGNRDLADGSQLYPCGDFKTLSLLMEKASPLAEHKNRLDKKYLLADALEKNMGLYGGENISP